MLSRLCAHMGHCSDTPQESISNGPSKFKQVSSRHLSTCLASVASDSDPRYKVAISLVNNALWSQP